MALFKELTDADGSKIIVNLDTVRVMQQITDRTTKIYFGNDAIKVKETLAEILMLDALNPVAIVFDFTEPVRAVRDDGRSGGEAEVKGHAVNDRQVLRAMLP